MSPRFTIRRKNEDPTNQEDIQLPLFGGTSKDDSKNTSTVINFPAQLKCDNTQKLHVM